MNTTTTAAAAETPRPEVESPPIPEADVEDVALNEDTKSVVREVSVEESDAILQAAIAAEHEICMLQGLEESSKDFTVAEDHISNAALRFVVQLIMALSWSTYVLIHLAFNIVGESVSSRAFRRCCDGLMVAVGVGYLHLVKVVSWTAGLYYKLIQAWWYVTIKVWEFGAVCLVSATTLTPTSVLVTLPLYYVGKYVLFHRSAAATTTSSSTVLLDNRDDQGDEDKDPVVWGVGEGSFAPAEHPPILTEAETVVTGVVEDDSVTPILVETVAA